MLRSKVGTVERASSVLQALRRFGSDAKPHPKYPKLLEPLKLRGGVTLKNRALMGSMHTGLEEPGGILSSGKLDQMAAYFAERAKGEVGLIVTGGISPNNAGKGYPTAAKMSTMAESELHNVVTDAVHQHGGKIAMQILHTGRYAYHPFAVSASDIKAPIGWFKPAALDVSDIYQTIDDFVRCAWLAKVAGYDGVEIMGSEGYLINQFLVQRTNKRKDEWGGSYKNRTRLPKEIVRRVREVCGEDFIIIYRLSMLDLVEGGSNWEEVVELARDIEAAGASIINTGIGWHEARIPTIATVVPRGGFAWVTQRMKGEVGIPLCTTNRINTPETAEHILASGAADMVSMARPFLADPHFVKKAIEGRADEINTCIGCNQACLDHIFVNKKASCLVNPRAANETELVLKPVAKGEQKRIAVVGAGPAGLACATSAASRGHKVTLFESSPRIGGQFNLAKVVPGKEEFFETLRYFGKQLQLTGVDVRLNTTAAARDLYGYDAVVLATGVTPRQVNIPVREGTSKVKVVSYVDVLSGKEKVGQRVAIIGAGGIGFDVAEFLTHDHINAGTHAGAALPNKVDAGAVKSFLQEWGVDDSYQTPGGLLPDARPIPPPRKVYLLQRKPGKLGMGLGKTTGWIHRTAMKRRHVDELAGCKYLEVSDEGLNIEQAGKPLTLPVDTVVLCAGQEPLRELHGQLKGFVKGLFLIGGAEEAAELDAKRAIDQGTRLAAVIEEARGGEVFQAEEESGHLLMKLAQRFVGKQ